MTPPKLFYCTADAEDMDAIYLMGYDAWSEGSSQIQYLENCRNSPKYKSGSWYVLSSDETPVASLLLHAFSPWNNWAVCGIGSVATALLYRNRGYASQLIEWVVADLTRQFPKLVVLLYSDIDPAFYERLGFANLPDSYQRFHNSRLMARMLPTWEESVLHTYGSSMPGYF